jgi:protein ImuB
MYACIHSTAAADGVSLKTRSGALLECARGFALTAELTNQETVVFSIAGLGLLYGPLEVIGRIISDRVERVGIRANIAIAHNADAAILIASCRSGLEIVRPDETEEKLSNLDVSQLPLSAEVMETLILWGIRTMGQLAKLPEDGVAQRLGEEGVKWQRLARGAVERPLIEVRSDGIFIETLELDFPIEVLEGLVFAIGRILTSLCNQLVMAGLAADELVVSLQLDDESEYQQKVRLPLPLDSSKPLLRIIRFELEKHPPQAAICAISISLHTVVPRRVQFGLFIPPSPEPAKLELTLARLRAMVGEDNVGVPQLIDSHHPQPFHLVPFSSPEIEEICEQDSQFVLSIRYCTPPIQSTLVFNAGTPERLISGKTIRRVTNAAGPWKLSGDWWNAENWNREEWDLGLANGMVCRVAHIGNEWFLEGFYD